MAAPPAPRPSSGPRLLMRSFLALVLAVLAHGLGLPGAFVALGGGELPAGPSRQDGVMSVPAAQARTR